MMKITTKLATIFLFIFAYAIHTSPALALSGILHQNIKLHGKIYIDGDLIIPPGKTLTILPGSTVRFSRKSKFEVVKDGLCNIVVYGKLRIIGMEEKDIWLGTPSYRSGKQTAGWGGIMLYKHASLTMQYTHIRYATVGIGIASSIPTTVYRTHISFCEFGIYVRNSKEANIIDSKLTNNFRGIVITSKNVKLVKDIINQNTIGILIKDSNNVEVKEEQIEENGTGIAVIDSKNVAISKSLFQNNVWGLAISNSKENITKISNSKFSRNFIGIVGFESSTITSAKNDFFMNHFAIVITDKAFINTKEKRINFIGNKRDIYYYNKGYKSPDVKY